MPRPPRADEAGGLYHALNRGNLRATIFHKDEDYKAFERILYEGLQIHQVELFSFQLMPNHYHLVLRPLVDGEMSRFMGWVGGTHTMRYHSHYHTSGMGHVYQQRDKSFPIQDDEHFFVVCRYVERNALLRQGWLIEPKNGSGARFIAGFANPNLTLHCCRRGHFLGFPAGSSGSTLRCRKRIWPPCVYQPNAANPLAMKAGSSRSPAGSILSQRCVRVAESEFGFRIKTSKRPDPFDATNPSCEALGPHSRY